MKTYEQILKETTDQFANGNNIILLQVNTVVLMQLLQEVAKRYASEAIKADRERIRALLLDKGSVCADGSGAYSPEMDLIDNLPIELK